MHEPRIHVYPADSGADRCSIPDCGRPRHARGWCIGHYQRWRTTGTPGGPIPSRDPEVRFWSKVDKRPDGCWLWAGNTTGTTGYGRFHIAGRMVVAHRWSWEQEHGPVPDGLVLDHLCRTRLCVNPDHLEPVTNRENVLRGIAARPHGCPDDHEVTATGSCRTCRRNYQRQWEQARKQDPEYLERRRAQDRARYQARKEAARGR